MNERQEKAKEIVKTHSLWGASMGLIPFPLVDMAAISAVQLKMIRDLSNAYDIPFQKDLVRSIVGVLLGGGIPYLAGTGGVGSLAKSIPLVGQFVGMAVMPALAGACTLAVGRVFTQHFESGGTLLDFDAEKMRAHFQKEFVAAKEETGADSTGTGSGQAEAGSTGSKRSRAGNKSTGETAATSA